MGKINQGILGGFAGKVGNVVGGRWKGINYMRVKPASVSNPKTDGQVGQRSKFAIVLQFLQPMKEHIKIGFRNYAVKKTEFNSAMSYNLNNAVIGEFPDFAIDYSSALVAKGSLPMALNADGGSDLVGNLQVTWSDNSEQWKANSTDKASILVYNETKAEAISAKTGASRFDGSYQIQLPPSYQNETVEVFVSFISEDGKELSNSVYAGSVTIIAAP